MIFGIMTRKEVSEIENNLIESNVVLKKKLEDKERTLRSYYSIFNKINKERGKLYNTKSERIKKKYAKKIDEKLEGM